MPVYKSGFDLVVRRETVRFLDWTDLAKSMKHAFEENNSLIESSICTIGLQVPTYEAGRKNRYQDAS